MTSPGRLFLAVVSLSVASCATQSPLLPKLIPPGAEAIDLNETPFFPQKEYQCGPAALATVLNHAGVATSPDALVDQVFLPAAKGSLQIELLAATRSAQRIPYIVEPTLEAIVAELYAGRPVLVLQNLGLRSMPIWHYAVVIGVMPATDRVILRSGTERRMQMDSAEFLRSWIRADRWAMVVISPGEFPASTAADRFTKAIAQAEPALSIPARKQAYRAVLDRWPKEITARFGYAHALHAADELEAAEMNYRAIVDQRPRHAAALNNLATVLADRGCYTQAVVIARRALEIANEDQRALVGPISETLRGFKASRNHEECTQGEEKFFGGRI